MATIVKTPSGTWKALIRKTGWPATAKTFRTKRDAEDWARRTEDEMVRGMYIHRAPAERMTVEAALKRYPLQKFDSDTERRFAVLLERDASKWFKPAKGQFQIYYKLGTEQPEYVPDFVAETDSMIFMVETKARSDMNTQEVQAKAAAAARWCKQASDHAATVDTKPWKYLLVPHDEIAESKRLVDFLRYEVKEA